MANINPTAPDAVSIALSKARAAATLAEITTRGTAYLQIPRREPAEHEVRDWIQGFAFDALFEAIGEADQASAAATKATVHG